MVKLNRIYTRTGDKGTTALADGQRRSKADLRVETYGTVDETNACIGLARLHTQGPLDQMLGAIQNDLFDLGADLATPPSPEPLPYEPLRIVASQVERLERDIDGLNEAIPPLKSFVLPVDRRPRRPCTSPEPSAAAPSAWRSASPPGRTRRCRRRRCATSTASPISCSWRAGPPIPTAPTTCSGCPAPIVEPGPRGFRRAATAPR